MVIISARVNITREKKTPLYPLFLGSLAYFNISSNVWDYINLLWPNGKPLGAAGLAFSDSTLIFYVDYSVWAEMPFVWPFFSLTATEGTCDGIDMQGCLLVCWLPYLEAFCGNLHLLTFAYLPYLLRPFLFKECGWRHSSPTYGIQVGNFLLPNPSHN